MDGPERRPPSIETLLASPAGRRLEAAHGRARLTGALREAADAWRRGALGGAEPAAGVLEEAERDLESHGRPGPRAVVNATGVLLHTNLGRAPLAAAAIAAVREAAGACALEMDLESGARGGRGAAARRLLHEVLLEGAPGLDALVVNNAAAAVLLALDTVANGRPVAISRGELVAIGGDFRVPAILAKSGASLLEVGTTNRTTPEDYAEALDAGAAALLKVHPSNFRMSGFVRETSVAELGALARSRGVPLVFDAGAATPARIDLGASPVSIPASLRDGVSLVAFSGDKSLGGPQAGILAGDAALVARAAANPLARALRPDKLALAALGATLDLLARGRESEIPFLAMLGADLAGLEGRAARLAGVAREAGLAAVVVETEAAAGGGSGADATIPSRAVALTPSDGDADRLAKALRGAPTPVVGRLADGRVLLDVRSVPPEGDAAIEQALRALAAL